MGYSNEFASLNQASTIKDYCNKKLKKRLKKIFQQRREIEKANIEIDQDLIYEPDNYSKPAISVDGGIATLFSGQVEEIKIVKVAYGCSEEDEDFFKNYMHPPVIFHVFSGVLKWNAGAGINPLTKKRYTNGELVGELIDEFFELEPIELMIANLQLDRESFHKDLFSFLLARVRKRSTVDDVIREILEWALIVNFWHKLNPIDDREDFPCVLIKDGSLFPGKQTMSLNLSQALEKFLLTEKYITVGVVKASRFVAEENSWSQVIKKYAYNLEGNKFFKLTKELEDQIDEKEINYERNFLSLFNASKLYEIQLPKSQSDIPVKREKVLDCINGLVSFNYGGSIVTNSYAHENASLSAFDANLVTQELSRELNDELRNLLKKLNSDKKNRGKDE